MAVVLPVAVAVDSFGDAAEYAGAPVSSEHLSSDTSFDDDAGTITFQDTLLLTLPHVAVNTVPGFGLGSLAQGDGRGFRNALYFDLLAWSLLGFGISTLNLDADGPLAGPAILSLFAGYGAYGVSRVYGAVRPVSYANDAGIDRNNLFSPVFYNQVPGFGAGSYIQGDQWGGSVGTILDFTAFVLVGVLSGAALGGEIAVSQAAGVGALAGFAAARIWGVVRPIRYRDETILFP